MIEVQIKLNQWDPDNTETPCPEMATLSEEGTSLLKLHTKFGIIYLDSDELQDALFVLKSTEEVE